VRELIRAEEPKRRDMLSMIGQYSIVVVPTSEEAEKLADLYVAESIIPERYVTDGVHIATAAVNDLDFIVSFNFQHIVKRKTIIMTEAVNLREGYRRVGIFSPTEVIENVE